MKLIKDETILELIMLLDLDTRGWQVVDNWNDDLFSVGIVSIERPDHLVYISTYGKPAGKYYYECEVSLKDEEQKSIGAREDAHFTELIDVLVSHLS